MIVVDYIQLMSGRSGGNRGGGGEISPWPQILARELECPWWRWPS